MSTENRTLNKDMNLIEKECGYWDYQIQLGDYTEATDKQSLRNGLIIACLTSWNYLNRKGNPTYEIFGNKAYQELNKKKSTMRQYLIKQYFIEVLNRIRRVDHINNIEVIDHPTDPNAYNVEFTVTSITDEKVNAKFPLSTSTTKGASYITVTTTNKTSTPINPTKFTITLMTEYGVPLENELIYMITSDDNVEVIGITNSKGEVTYNKYPSSKLGKDTVSFRFNGNSLFNHSENYDNTYYSIPFVFQLDNSDELYIKKHPQYSMRCWLAEIVESTDEMTSQQTNYFYMLKENDTYYRYKNINGGWVKEDDGVYSMINQPTNIETNQIRLFVEDIDKRIYIVDDEKINLDSTLEMFKDHIIIEL